MMKDIVDGLRTLAFGIVDFILYTTLLMMVLNTIYGIEVIELWYKMYLIEVEMNNNEFYRGVVKFLNTIY